MFTDENMYGKHYLVAMIFSCCLAFVFRIYSLHVRWLWFRFRCLRVLGFIWLYQRFVRKYGRELWSQVACLFRLILFFGCCWATLWFFRIHIQFHHSDFILVFHVQNHTQEHRSGDQKNAKDNQKVVETTLPSRFVNHTSLWLWWHRVLNSWTHHRGTRLVRISAKFRVLGRIQYRTWGLGS